jgi:hypothetical protein
MFEYATYADVCRRMLTYACVCRRGVREQAAVGSGWDSRVGVLRYDVCSRMQLRMLTYADVCWRSGWDSRVCVLRYDVCSRMHVLRMLTYADVCWRWPQAGCTNTRMLTYAGTTYADVCWRMLTYADVCVLRLGARIHVSREYDRGQTHSGCDAGVVRPAGAAWVRDGSRQWPRSTCQRFRYCRVRLHTSAFVYMSAYVSIRVYVNDSATVGSDMHTYIVCIYVYIISYI